MTPETRPTTEPPTPVDVIFRVFTDDAGDDDVIAVFPYEPATATPGIVLSYQHIGQHGAADLGILRRPCTRPATADEYAPLLRELRAIGYAPRVIRRVNRARHRAAFAR